jgi:hypothetical protein
VAPYCTIAVIYNLLEKLLFLVVRFPRRGNPEQVFIFGYNEQVKLMLEASLEGKTFLKKPFGNYKVTIIGTGKLDKEEHYQLTKKGCIYHELNFFKTEDKELFDLFSQIGLKHAGKILLFEENSIDNFSLLQMLLSASKDEKNFPNNAKIFCRCEDGGTRQMMETLFDESILQNAEKSGDAKAGKSHLDVEIISLTELQIRAMYKKTSLHKYYMGDGNNDKTPDRTPEPKDWTVHLLILGFGNLGQQALLQAMNLGVVHSENRICVDVVDQKIDEAVAVFSNRFSTETVQIDGGHLSISAPVADGNFDVYFHKMNVKYEEFRKLLRQMNQEIPYTYIVIALENTELSMHSLYEIKSLFQEKKPESIVPIMIRMDSNLRLAAFIKDNEKTFKGVQLIEDSLHVLTLDMLFDEQINNNSTETHQAYVEISDNKDEWGKIKLYKRNSNRALSYHQDVLRGLLEYYERCFSEEEYKNKKKKVEQHLEKIKGLQEGLDEKRPDYQEQIKQLNQLIQENSFILEMAQLEHRRWCYYMASIGWRYIKGKEKIEEKKQTPCLCTWEILHDESPKYCQYDLLPLISLKD